MMAGASMSGDLKNPQVNIPHGTLWSITMSTVVYAAVICILGATVERLAPDDTRGLYHNFYVMVDVAPWKWLVFFGILCSTFSSAVASIIVAPRILKAVCDDGLFPYLSYFARGRASDNEPIRGYLLSFIVALFFIMIGEINLLVGAASSFLPLATGVPDPTVSHRRRGSRTSSWPTARSSTLPSSWPARATRRGGAPRGATTTRCCRWPAPCPASC